MTDEQIMTILQRDGPIRRAVSCFNAGCGQIEQAQAQRNPISPVKIRGMQIEIVVEIARIFGVEVTTP